MQKCLVKKLRGKTTTKCLKRKARKNLAPQLKQFSLIVKCLPVPKQRTHQERQKRILLNNYSRLKLESKQQHLKQRRTT